MLVLKNDALQVTMADDGTQVVLDDRLRGQRWRLDPATRLVSRGVGKHDHAPFAAEATAAGEKVCTIGPGQARMLNATSIQTEHRTPAGGVTLRWMLERDRIRVLADADDAAGAADAAGVDSLALPGTFRPIAAPDAGPAGSFLAAVPFAQGVLHTGKGPAFYRAMNMHGHGGCNMDMFGQIAPRGGLLVINETDADSYCHWEKTAAGDVRLMWLMRPRYARLAYTREVVIFATPPGVTPICKLYRRYEIAKGRFKSWDEKIAERPNVAKLFGSAIVFIGYHHDDTLDYADSFRRLKAMGIDKAFVYPVYTASTLNMDAAGLRWIDERKHLGLLHELGYAAASFIYIMDGPRDERTAGRDFFFDDQGKPVLAWQIDDAKWFAYSAGRRFEAARELLDTQHAGLDGMHYDVLCCAGLREDHHPAHLDDCRADAANRVEMLKYAGAKNLIVSSEGFWGRMTPHYDLGSCKFAHVLGGDEYCCVPMTMLVYHDSAYHTWWEVDNYNNFEHRTQWARGHSWHFPWGGGGGRVQAAIDAILGVPPDIFPFGKQYNYVPHSHPKMYTYTMRLDDALVREAIEYAKPVMALNRRVGKLEMADFKMHRPDGAVQESVFADGTRVLANFANAALEAPGAGLLPPESWRML